GLGSAGFAPNRPEGAYYVLCDIRPFGFDDDTEFAHWLIRDVGVAGVPGSSFFSRRELGRHLIRFTFCKTEELLEEASRRLLGARETARRRGSASGNRAVTRRLRVSGLCETSSVPPCGANSCRASSTVSATFSGSSSVRSPGCRTSLAEITTSAALACRARLSDPSSVRPTSARSASSPWRMRARSA